MKLLPSLLPLLLCACPADRALLEPVAQARGELVVAAAQPAVQASVGMAAVTAALCGTTLEEWQAMGSTAPALPDPVAAWFGLGEPGALKAYPARGQFSLTWGGGSFFGQDVALVVDVATPMSAFVVQIVEAGHAAADDTALDTGSAADPAQALASGVFATTSCGGEAPQLTGTLSFPISGEYGWAVSLVAGEEDDGMVVLPGAVLPSRGGLSWSGTVDFGRATLLTDDASTIAEDRWPATAAGRGWETSVGLALD